MFYTYFKNSLFSFSSLKNIHYYFMIKNFLKNKKIKNIHYLFENISWEKSLNFLAKNIICKAYHHTFLIDWDMRYEIHEKEKKEIKKYLPKVIYSSSQLIIKNLKKKMKIKKEITFKKISSLRYSDNCISNQTKTKKINKILVVGDVDEEVTWKMVNLVNKSKLSFDLKVHPASNYKVFKKSNVKTVDGDLNFLIRKYKFILCGNSSSSVYNCKLNNVNFFVYKDFYDLNINPFKNTNLKYITNMKDFDKLR